MKESSCFLMLYLQCLVLLIPIKGLTNPPPSSDEVKCLNAYTNTNGKKTCICHVPPGNPGNAHAIIVGTPSVPAHKNNHGDYIIPSEISYGACVPATPPSGPIPDGGARWVDNTVTSSISLDIRSGYQHIYPCNVAIGCSGGDCYKDSISGQYTELNQNGDPELKDFLIYGSGGDILGRGEEDSEDTDMYYLFDPETVPAQKLSGNLIVNLLNSKFNARYYVVFCYTAPAAAFLSDSGVSNRFYWNSSVSMNDTVDTQISYLDFADLKVTTNWRCGNSGETLDDDYGIFDEIDSIIFDETMLFSVENDCRFTHCMVEQSNKDRPSALQHAEITVTNSVRWSLTDLGDFDN